MGIKKRILNYCLKSAYYVGFINEEYLSLSRKERFKKISWLDLKDYKGGWFADPFFLSVEGNHIQLLVEEMNYQRGKGIISLLDIKVNNELIKNTPVLELQTHLSFPFVWREDNKVYVCPENWEGGSFRIYEFDKKENKLINPVIIIDAPLVDSSIFKHEGKYFVIGTIRKPSSAESTKTADIFVADSFLGPYKHLQSLHNDKKRERGAGAIFKVNDDLIRPVQKCDEKYGEAVIFNKLIVEDGIFDQ